MRSVHAPFILDWVLQEADSGDMEICVQEVYWESPWDWDLWAREGMGIGKKEAEFQWNLKQASDNPTRALGWIDPSELSWTKDREQGLGLLMSTCHSE